MFFEALAPMRPCAIIAVPSLKADLHQFHNHPFCESDYFGLLCDKSLFNGGFLLGFGE